MGKNLRGTSLWFSCIFVHQSSALPTLGLPVSSVERYTSMQLVCFANQRFTFTHRYTTPRTEGLVLIDALTAVLFFHSEIHFLIFTLDISESDLHQRLRFLQIRSLKLTSAPVWFLFSINQLTMMRVVLIGFHLIAAIAGQLPDQVSFHHFHHNKIGQYCHQ